MAGTKPNQPVTLMKWQHSLLAGRQNFSGLSKLEKGSWLYYVIGMAYRKWLKFKIFGMQNAVALTSPTRRLLSHGASANLSKTGGSSFEYCLNLIRQHDYESFLCTLLIPNQKIRSDLVVLRAFNTEVSIIRDHVSQSSIGLARLEFWKNAVNDLYRSKKSGGVDLKYQQPTLLELGKVIHGSNISKHWFNNLLVAREKTLTDIPFKTLAELQSYSENTVTPLMYMVFESCGVKNIDVDHASSHIGKAIGLSTFIRSIPYNAQKGRVLIPIELLTKYNLTQEDFIRKRNTDKIKDLVFEIATTGHNHYATAQSIKKKIPKDLLPVFMIGVPSHIYLKRLERVGFDPYHVAFNQRYGLLPFHLYYMKLTKKYF